jgi:hypothetical protein
MEPLFLIVAGAIALTLILIVGRNLVRLDRQERERYFLSPPPPDEPPDRTAKPVTPPSPQIPPSPQVTPPRPSTIGPNRTIPTDRMEQTRPQEPVAFSAYAPKEAAPNGWQPLLGYIYRQTAANVVRNDAQQQLGSKAGDFRETGDTSARPIEEEALVTATPMLDGFQVNPPSLTLGFYEDWQRFDFKIRPTTAPLQQAVNGRLSFSVEGVIVADVPLSVYVGETAVANAPTQGTTAKAYDAIFCSYSRQDIHIIERVERAYKILGLDYLRDMISIRSGEDWNDALKRMIDRADIFQLFWSNTAATSKHVQMEWEYALSLPNKPQNFVRPVFWQKPMPPVPQPLQHIHFAYDETLDD